MTEPYSDLQIDHQQQFPKYSLPNSHDADKEAHNPAYVYSDKIAAEGQSDLQRGKRKRICGLAARTFWIVAAIVAFIIIAAAVGGGVGGSLAGKNSDNKSAAASTSSQLTITASVANTVSTSAPSSSSAGPITSSVPSTTTTVSLSTSTTIGPTETLLIDCPSSNNTFYQPPNFPTQLYTKTCSLSYLSNGINVVLQNTSSLNGCIDACANYNVQNATNIADGASNVCNAVCWRYTIIGDDYPGTCFGFTTTNSSGGFVYEPDTRCDSAALVNQSF
jgi:hypothetical protein